MMYYDFPFLGLLMPLYMIIVWIIIIAGIALLINWSSQQNQSKIYQRAAFLILVIIITGLLNICLFAWQAKTATAPMLMPKINFVYDNSGNYLAEPIPKPTQTINYPSVPMPECCLSRNRNFATIVNIANDKSTSVFTNLIILSSDTTNFENNSTHHTSRLAYPPPAALALASTIIRE